MFVQVIQGQVANAEGLQSQMDEWIEKLSPGAVGWLGSTSGITADGRAILLARFESAEAAQANSDRPEQGTWWSATAKCFNAEPEFHESGDIEFLADGGSDDAGFVQVMQGASTNRAGLRALEREFEPALREVHTGLIGSMRCWYGNDEYTEAIYFSDEATARAGEKAMGEHPDFAAQMDKFQELTSADTFFDLVSPRLATA
jgi:hypothetical protein